MKSNLATKASLAARLKQSTTPHQRDLLFTWVTKEKDGDKTWTKTITRISHPNQEPQIVFDSKPGGLSFAFVEDKFVQGVEGMIANGGHKQTIDELGYSKTVDMWMHEGDLVMKTEALRGGSLYYIINAEFVEPALNAIEGVAK